MGRAVDGEVEATSMPAFSDFRPRANRNLARVPSSGATSLPAAIGHFWCDFDRVGDAGFSRLQLTSYSGPCGRHADGVDRRKVDHVEAHGWASSTRGRQSRNFDRDRPGLGAGERTRTIARKPRVRDRRMLQDRAAECSEKRGLARSASFSCSAFCRRARHRRECRRGALS